jgi:hypothetical protein
MPASTSLFLSLLRLAGCVAPKEFDFAINMQLVVQYDPLIDLGHVLGSLVPGAPPHWAATTTRATGLGLGGDLGWLGVLRFWGGSGAGFMLAPKICKTKAFRADA